MKQKEKKNKAKRKKYKIFSIKYLFYDFVKWTGAIPMALFFRMKKIRMGKKQKVKGGAIMMSNHIGLLDPIVLHFVYPFRRLWSLAMQELFDMKFWKHFFKGVNCIPVNRENVTIDMYHSVSDVLSSGKLLAMFPEGKINFEDDAEVKKFKGGVALFAIMNKVPIIPTYIVKKTKKLERQKIVIGEPIYLESICDGVPTLRDVERVSEYLHQKEEELVSYYSDNYLSKKERSKNDKFVRS